jgi:hypothetical protein
LKNLVENNQGACDGYKLKGRLPMDQIVRFETRAGVVIATDEAGRRFVTAASKFDSGAEKRRVK